jgi:hypothetical protein
MRPQPNLAAASPVPIAAASSERVSGVAWPVQGRTHARVCVCVCVCKMCVRVCDS